MAKYEPTDEHGNCLFCTLVAGDIPSYTIWENDTHMAFLTPFPNTEGFSVVITKEHQPSAVLELPKDVYDGIMHASKEVAGLLKNAFEDVGRVGLLVEGLGIDHAHTKLMPLHKTAQLDEEWEQLHSNIDKYFEHYEGYLSSHDGPKKDAEELKATQQKILEAK